MVHGKFSLKFTNIHTGAVRVVDNDNVWTQSGEDYLLNPSRYMYYFNGQGVPMHENEAKVNLLLTPVLGGLKTANVLSNITTVGPNSTENVWAVTGTNPIIRTREDRFQPPAVGTTRSIYGLALGNPNYGLHYGILAYTALVSPCIQTDSEVLDVVYRLEVNTTNGIASPTSQYVKNFNFGDSVFRTWAGGVGTSNYTSKIASVASGWFKMPLDASKYTNFYSRADDDSFLMRGDRWDDYYGIYARVPTIRRNYVGSYVATSFVGNLLRTALYSNNVQEADSNFERVQCFTPIFNEAFPNKPVQPIHNHSKDAIAPFIDVNFLANGRGGLSVQPGTWTDTTGMLEYWRVDMTTTGQVGTAKYFVRKNIRGEFDENSYTHEQRNNNQIPALHAEGDLWTGTATTKTADTAHITPNMQNSQAWTDHKTVINHNLSGITLTDITNNDHINFDAVSVPALPVTKVYQVAVLAGGDIFVACAMNGLWRISDPLSSPVVTKITPAVDNTIDVNKCFAVCEGYNNSLWAVFDGGVCHSSDGAVTWTAYTTANGGWKHRSTVLPEEISGTTNWSLVRMVRADISKANHELGFVRYSASNSSWGRGDLVWWSPGRDAVDHYLNAPIASGVVFSGLLAGDAGPARTGFFRCSRVDSFWAIRTLWEQGSYKLTNWVYFLNHYGMAFKTVPYTDYGSMYPWNNWGSVAKGQYGNLGFLYDNYGKAYGGWGSLHYAGGDNPCTTYTYDRFSTQTFATGTAGVTYAPIMSEVPFEHYNLTTGPSPYVASSVYGAYIANAHLTNYTGYSNNTDTTRPVNDPLNGKAYATKDFSWIDYRWNGTAWLPGYHAPLVDNSGKSNDAVRHLFGIESHVFTGRSSLNVSSVVGEDFSQGMTVVGTYSFANKPLSHSLSHTFFSTGKLNVYRNMTTPNEIRVISQDQGGINILPYVFASEANNRIATTVTSTPNTSYNFKRSKLNELNVDGLFFSISGDSMVGYVLPESDTVTPHMYNTYYSPVYTEMAGDDISIRFKPTIPSTGGPGEGLRIAVRYGNYEFTNSLDTYFGGPTADKGGARPQDGVCVYIPPTGAPSANHLNTTLAYTQTTAITTADINGTNRLELRFKITAGTLTVTLYRIADGVGPITPIVMGTWTKTGSFTSGGKNGIIMITPQYNTYAITAPTTITQFELYNNTTVAPFGKTAYTSTVKVHVNGTLAGTVNYATDVPLNTFNELWIGMNRYKKENFFTGTLANPQVWNVAWDASDVAADAGAITGTLDTGTAPIANLLARYDMTQALVETRLTHTAPAPLPGGHTIAFGNGASDGSSTFAFYGTDYYTFGMFDGVLKDNAISFDIKQEMYVRPTDFSYSSLESPNELGVQSNLIAATTVKRIELVQFRDTTTSRRLGELVGVSAGDATVSDDRAVSVQTVTGDGWVEGKVTLRSIHNIGLQTAMLSTSAVTGTGAFILLTAAGGFTCWVNNVVVHTAPAATYSVGDVFRVERTNTATAPEFRFYRNGSLIVSSVSGPAGTLCANFGDMNFNPAGWAEVKMNYLRQWPSLDIGDFALRSGKFDPAFITFVDDRLGLWSVKIDGVEATKVLVGDKTGSTIGNYSIIPATIPVGSVYIIPDIGVLFFSTDDIGKLVTVEAPLVTYE